MHLDTCRHFNIIANPNRVKCSAALLEIKRVEKSEKLLRLFKSSLLASLGVNPYRNNS
jgi:hypothetical protein